MRPLQLTASVDQVDAAENAALKAISALFEGNALMVAEAYIKRCAQTLRNKEPIGWKKRRKSSLEEELIDRATLKGETYIKNIETATRKGENVLPRHSRPKRRASIVAMEKTRDKLSSKASKRRKKQCRHELVQDADDRCRLVCRLCGKTHWSHDFCAHPVELFKISCLHCNHGAASAKKETEDNELLRYLSARRKLRYIENLHSLCLPMAASSFHMLSQIMSKLRITSNTEVLHITLLEGVVTPSEGFREQVIKSLRYDPSCHVVAVKLLPTVDPELRLVIVNVSLPAWVAVSSVTATPTRLPQWPLLHFAMGTIRKDQIMRLGIDVLEHQLMGQVFYANPEKLTWLAPNARIGLRRRKDATKEPPF